MGAETKNEQVARELDRLIDNFLNREFPVHTDVSTGIHETSAMLHYHEYIEICYIRQGKGTYLVGGKKYDFTRGDIFVINSNEVHLAYNDKDVLMQILLFKPELFWDGVKYTLEIEYLKPFWEFGKYFENKIDVSSKYYPLITEILDDLLSEYDDKKCSYQVMMKSLLFKLSAILNRYQDVKYDTKLPERIKNYSRFQPLFDYLDHYYFKKIKLEDMANIVNMSVPNFGVVFKNTMGISPMEYLIRRRIVKASKLLIETDMKIVDIAENCGFHTMSHFLVCFKKYTGKVPKDFRNIKK